MSYVMDKIVDIYARSKIFFPITCTVLNFVVNMLILQNQGLSVKDNNGCEIVLLEGVIVI